MTTILRIEMVLLSVIFLFFVLQTVRKKKLQVQYALIWIVLALGTFCLAVIPGVAEKISALVGIETTSNFVYLLAVLALLILSFSLTVIVSKQAQKIKNITQIISIRETLQREQSEDDI